MITNTHTVTPHTLAPFSLGLGGSRLLYVVQKSAIFIVATSSAVSSFCLGKNHKTRQYKTRHTPILAKSGKKAVQQQTRHMISCGV